MMIRTLMIKISLGFVQGLGFTTVSGTLEGLVYMMTGVHGKYTYFKVAKQDTNSDT